MKILITGGLGYIGSHIAHLLKDKAVIIDNQVNSKLDYKKFLPLSHVYISDLNSSICDKIFNKYEIKGVIHLASLKAVEDSVSQPLKYYKNNFLASIELLNSMEKHSINKLIFSSSATVYGNIYPSPLREDLLPRPNNPYGNTKVLIEKLIEDYSMSNKKFKAISLRYFNPIGANISAGLADRPLGKPKNIMPILIDCILDNKKFNIFGNNYKTKDGTCLRDYIHVIDVAMAHIKALKSLNKINGHVPINIGIGKGLSVIELINIFEKINKVNISFNFASKRKGDSAISYANNNLAKKILNWKPKYTYKDMVRDAWLSAINQ